ncbi:MAG: hypothetical protein LCI00_32160 [Chloroflexi bacterium]|nr:hypothetical protein [Chloroflexota bacterium]MCC6894235.1 hypothetical protein [Anaerolineae bacterium]
MLTLVYNPQDAALAQRVMQDLKAQGFAFKESLTAEKGMILLAVTSPAANDDATVQNVVIQAFDNNQHVVLLTAQPAPIPKIMNHLRVFDFSSSYPLPALAEHLLFLASPEAGSPLKVLTPKTRAKNRGIGIWLTILVLVWFVVGLVVVGVFRIQAPVEEYNTVETEYAATVASIVQQNLPRSTEEAENFPATVQAVTTAQRPVLIQTATALVAPRPTRSGFSY